ncbi:Ig-like domain-containing protein [Isobaculum melis]|uniref:Ig-like domain (Group 3) n=1 Tax=Isobaculum melis TaxID=142588 RepID=A0A1H9PUN4_9LACT|nr:Ig-like domain-containing protein [Isobaculum melis]SER51499.1 hypothetical protein SAMN04488559_101127 [Isobaculum melis]
MSFNYKKTLASAILLGAISSSFLGGTNAEASTYVNNPTNFLANPNASLFVPHLSAMNQRVADEFDVTKNWRVTEFKSTIKTPIQDVFTMNRTRPGTDITYTSIGFSNLGKTTFKAHKVIPMKKGKTYKLNLLYGLHTVGNAKAWIDFNGTKVEVAGSDQKYTEEITPDADMDYVITMEYNALKYSNVFLMVGFDGADQDGGITETSSVEKPFVNTPEAKTRIITGVGEDIGNTVRIFDSSNREIGRGTVDRFRDFNITTNRDLVYNETLTAIQYNDKGYESDPMTVKVDDTISPDQPIVKAIEVTDQLVQGTAEADSTVIVRNANGQEIGRATALFDGSFDFKLAKKAKEGDKVYITATDAAGNESTATEVPVVDNSTPEAPQVNPVTDLHTTVSGNTKQGNCEVTVEISGDTFTGTSDANGNFTVQLGKTYQARTVVHVTSTNQAGKVSPTTTVTIQAEKRTESPTVNDVYDNSPMISGTAEENATINVTIDGDTHTTQANAAGNYTINMGKNYAAGSTGSVTATGLSGKESLATPFVVQDVTAPDAPAVDKVTEADAHLTGRTEAGATVDVTVTDASTNRRYVYQKVADATGEFDIELNRLFPVGSQIQVTATDPAGNVSDPTNVKVENSIILDIDLDEVNSQSEEVTGFTSRPFSDYTVQIGNAYITGTSDANGDFVIELDELLSLGTVIKYSAQEGTDQTTVKTLTVLPRRVTLKPLRAGDLDISGSSDPNAEITIHFNLNAPITVTADQDGNFSYQLAAPIKVGDSVKVTQTLDGYTSPASTSGVYTR